MYFFDQTPQLATIYLLLALARLLFKGETSFFGKVADIHDGWVCTSEK